MCPSNLFWWFGNTSCATLPRRDWPYRVISYDPFESNLFTIFDYGSVPLECLQLDFRCVLNDTLKEQNYQLGTLWFRCVDNPKFKQRFLVSESPIHSTVTYVPIPTCAPPLTLFNIAYVKIIAGRHLLLSTCRNDENELGITQVHHKGHLLLSSGPPEDDWGILGLARRVFNQNFSYWRPKEANLRIFFGVYLKDPNDKHCQMQISIECQQDPEGRFSKHWDAPNHFKKSHKFWWSNMRQTFSESAVVTAVTPPAREKFM
ncbi:hypothetical protein pipiens_014554 [Culex pipiens pipiens]|uniref:Uncharacterized protein n=1 Tax=Culex pipiens pipiens TaxID=38569 RepID=A0ABD1CU47_CULPP